MAYPTDVPVRKLILDDVVSTIAAVTAGATFRSTIEKVRVIGRNVFEQVDYPCVLIAPPSQTMNDRVHPLITAKLTMQCSGAVEDGDDDEAMSAAYDLIEDIKLALTADITRGGHALDTHITSDEPYVPDVSTPIFGIDFTVEVDYRHRYSDPSVAM